MVLLRDSLPEDGEVLIAALLDAVNWDGSTRWTSPRLLADPLLSRFVVDWPRSADFGTVAADGGAVVGAAWCRLLGVENAAHGYVAGDVPVLTIGVRQGHRGRGAGTGLLEALIATAATRGHGAISLNVEDGNRARSLYERAGFVVLGRQGASETMLLELRPRPAPATDVRDRGGRAATPGPAGVADPVTRR